MFRLTLKFGLHPVVSRELPKSRTINVVSRGLPVPKAMYFLARQCSTRRTNSCKAVFVETPARNLCSDAESFDCTFLSLLINYDTEIFFLVISVGRNLK